MQNKMQNPLKKVNLQGKIVRKILKETKTTSWTAWNSKCNMQRVDFQEPTRYDIY